MNKRVIKSISIMVVIVMLGILMFPKEHILEKNTIKITDNKAVKLYVNDEEEFIPEDMGEIFINKDGRTMLPLRFFSERLGMEVEWDAENYIVTVDDEIKVTVGDRNAVGNNGPVVMDTEPVIIKGRTYVPLRFLAENSYIKVSYKQTESEHIVFLDNRDAPVIIKPVVPPVENPGGTHEKPYIDTRHQEDGVEESITLIKGSLPKEAPIPVFRSVSTKGNTQIILENAFDFPNDSYVKRFMVTPKFKVLDHYEVLTPYGPYIFDAKTHFDLIGKRSGQKTFLNISLDQVGVNLDTGELVNFDGHQSFEMDVHLHSKGQVAVYRYKKTVTK